MLGTKGQDVSRSDINKPVFMQESVPYLLLSDVELIEVSSKVESTSEMRSRQGDVKLVHDGFLRGTRPKIQNQPTLLLCLHFLGDQHGVSWDQLELFVLARVPMRGKEDSYST